MSPEQMLEHIDRLSSVDLDDEIAVTMNPGDFYLLFKLLKKQPQLCQRLCAEAEVITMEWLDKKRAEFP